MSIRAGVREIFTPQSFPFCISSAVMPPILMHISALVLTYIPDGPPDHVLVQGLNKVTHNLLGLTQVVGLYFPDLLVTDASEEVVTRGLVRATRQPCDLTHIQNFTRIHLSERLLVWQFSPSCWNQDLKISCLMDT